MVAGSSHGSEEARRFPGAAGGRANRPRSRDRFSVPAAPERAGSAIWPVAKRMLQWLGLSLLVIAIAGVVHYMLSTRLASVERAAMEREQVEFGRIAIERSLDIVSSDLFYLAESGSRNGQFDPLAPDGHRELQENFRLFVEKRGIYDQLRFLDLGGMEIVRVNLADGRALVVPGEMLQDKSQRYYFQDAVVLRRGELYVSPLDLNVERGEVEIPFKPVLRIATPVFDRNGNKSGILVLNYLGDQLLQGFRVAASRIFDRVMLLNADGYWMRSPNPEDEWGFMFGVERTFATDYPNAWARIQAGDVGRFQTDNGVFTFATARPRVSAGAGSGPQGEAVSTAHVWKIVLHDALPRVGDNIFAFVDRYLIVYLFVILLAAAGAFLTARLSVRRRLLEGELVFERRFRQVLENVDLLAVGIDADGRIVFCNQALEQFVGRSEDELLGRDWFDACVPADRRQPGREAFLESLAGGKATRRYQGEVELANGARRTVNWNDTFLRDPDDILYGLVRIGNVPETQQAP